MCKMPGQEVLCKSDDLKIFFNYIPPKSNDPSIFPHGILILNLFWERQATKQCAPCLWEHLQCVKALIYVLPEIRDERN